MSIITRAFNRRKQRKLDNARSELRELSVMNWKNSVRRDRARRISAVAAGIIRGGGSGGTVTGGSKTPGGLSRSGMTRLFDHKELRRNIRDAMYDSPPARTIASRFADSIADTGLQPLFEPNWEALGISEEEADEWGRKRSAEFGAYLKSKHCVLDGLDNGYQSQHFYAFSQQRDNDIYVRLHYNRDANLISPVQIQFIDPDQLMGYCYTSTDGLQMGMDSGIEYDKHGRELAYNFGVWNPSKRTFKDVKIRRFGSRSGRTYILHCFRKEFAGQKQGYALYSHLLQEFEDITTLQSSHVQKAINQSTFGFFTKPSKNAPASGGIDDYATDSVAAISDFLGADAVDAMSSDELSGFTANVLKEFSIRNPGTVWNTSLAAGESMESVKQTAPADKFAEFVESLVSFMSASSGMPIEVLLMKFGQNYSASRATLVLFWRIVNMWRAEMESDFLNPWAEAWMSEEIAAGRVKAPGWSDPRMRAAWMNIRWIGSSMPSIDPKKESEADMNRVILGHETLDDGALRYNGSDGRANRAKLRRQLEELPTPSFSKNGGNTEPDNGDGDGVDEKKQQPQEDYHETE